jgi:hypothetical protein
MHGSRRYLVPIDTADGTSPAEAGGHGIYTLTASHTYVYLDPTLDTPFTSFDLTGYDAGLVITSATIQDTNHPGSVTAGGPNGGDVPDTSVTVGEWKNERPTNGYVAADGAGWSVGSGATACVVAASGAGVGGALWHVAETGAARTRLNVVVGGTGGKVRVSAAGK